MALTAKQKKDADAVISYILEELAQTMYEKFAGMNVTLQQKYTIKMLRKYLKNLKPSDFND
jgi:hypothetical protein